MLNDGLQPRVADTLAVVRADVPVAVAHDGVRRRLVARLVGNGPERVPQRVDPQPLAAVDAQLAEQLAGLLAHRAGRRAPVPRLAALGEEDQPGMFGALRLRAAGEGFFDGCRGLRPQRAAAG